MCLCVSKNKMKKLKTVLIDDNPHAIAGMKEDLARWFPQLEVVGEADGVVTGAKVLRQLQPDLLFLDIQMGDGTGFDLLEIVPDLNFQLIFTTAHDEHALRAFKFAAVDYLLKPIDPDELKRAVERVLQNQNENEHQNEKISERIPMLQAHFQQQEVPKTIALHTAEKIHIARIKDIVRMEASGNYTNVYFIDNQRLLLTKTLKELAQLLGDSGFLRTHQSHLVNLDHLREFVKTDGGYLVLSDGAKVPVSVRKRSEVLERLG